MEPTPETMLGLFGGTEVSAIADPYPVYARLRREAPAVFVETMAGRGAYFITRHRDVHTILRDDHIYSNRANEKGIGLVMGRTIIGMDGAEHLRHRKLVGPSFAPHSLNQDFQAAAAATAHSLIDRFADRGRAELVEEFTFTYPLRVFCSILGLPVEDYAAFHRWAIDLTLIAREPARGLAASRAMAEYLHPILEQRRSDPADDLISALAQAEVEGHRLTDEEVTSFLRLLVVAGAETTYHLIGSTLVALLRERELLEALRVDRSMMDAVMNEAVRWEPPIQMVSRETVEPVSIAGVELPAGAEILASIGSANHDEAEFDQPERFEINRDRGEHIAFGFGRHFCVGARLAKAEFHVAMNALLDRLPDLTLEPGYECGVVGLAFRGPDRLPVRFGAAG